MRKIFIYSIAAIIMAFVFTACGGRSGSGGNSNASVRWEYKVVSTYNIGGETGFNELGREGWEYVGSFGQYGQDLTFKRRLP